LSSDTAHKASPPARRRRPGHPVLSPALPLRSWGCVPTPISDCIFHLRAIAATLPASAAACVRLAVLLGACSGQAALSEAIAQPDRGGRRRPWGLIYKRGVSSIRAAEGRHRNRTRSPPSSSDAPASVRSCRSSWLAPGFPPSPSSGAQTWSTRSRSDVKVTRPVALNLPRSPPTLRCALPRSRRSVHASQSPSSGATAQNAAQQCWSHLPAAPPNPTHLLAGLPSPYRPRAASRGLVYRVIVTFRPLARPMRSVRLAYCRQAELPPRSAPPVRAAAPAAMVPAGDRHNLFAPCVCLSSSMSSPGREAALDLHPVRSLARDNGDPHFLAHFWPVCTRSLRGVCYPI